ncbi:MFS transporter [Stipitochalara longipes BDJ]|nr:MFS transporter [Stipitochalara longipes BDJ]
MGLSGDSSHQSGVQENAEKTVFDPSSENEITPDGSITAVTVDWTPDEERRLVRKLDRIVMPLLMLAFGALQYDRGNIGNALTDFFFRDVGIKQNQFNVGQQLLSAGIVILEIPSNLVLYRVGPSIWISCQIFAWGLVALFQAFQKGLGAFLATRLILGLCESGFIPAGLFSITLWYKKEELSARFAWFFIGNMLAQASSGLIAYGVLQMRGVGHLAGWQWLFILEGLFTILVAGIFATLFPGTPKNPKTLTGIGYFSEREVHILRRRVQFNNSNDGTGRKTISLKELTRTLTDWRIYPHLILTICALSPSSVLWSYAPTLVGSFGYPRLQSNALVSVGGWLLLVVNVFWGWVADKTQKRGYVVLAGLSIWWGFALGNLILTASTDKTSRYAILTLAMAFASPWHAVNGSWLAVNGRSPADRSIRMAMFIMSANCSGIVGSQLFQAKDAPHYRTGWTVIVALISFAIVLATFNVVQYWLLNKALDKARVSSDHRDGEQEEQKSERYYI